MIGNFFRTRKDKKKVPARASFRPMLESLEERVVPAASLPGGQTFGTALQAIMNASPTSGSQSLASGGQTFGSQTSPYLQALMSASPTQIQSIVQNMVTAGTAAMSLMASGSTPNSAAISQYASAVTNLFTQMSTLVQSYTNAATSVYPYTSVVSSNPYSVLSQSPYFSSLSQPIPSNQFTTGNGISNFGGSSIVAPSYSGQFVGY